MSTTRLMHKERQILNPWVLSEKQHGQSISKKTMDIHVLLLHDPKNKDINLQDVIQNYTSFGTQEISIVNFDGTMFSDDIKNSFSKVNFLHVNKEDQAKKVSPVALMINRIFQAVSSDKIFISWTDIDPFGMSSKAIERDLLDYSFCTVPAIEDENSRFIVSTYTPQFILGNFRVFQNNQNPLYPYTLLPYDYIGIYNRKNFLHLGGFDSSILDPWVQLFDFGVRSYKNNNIIKLSAYYRVRKNSSKRRSFNKKNNAELCKVCIRESIGNQLVNITKCLMSDVRQFFYVISMLLSKNIRSSIKFKKIVKEFWH